MIEIEVHTRGPVFDGRAAAAAHAYTREVVMYVGQQGFADVMTNLDESIKHPTPYYETQVLVERVREDAVVHDRGIIYGPWLEGVGSRNDPVTRFKGYFSFRRAAQKLRGEATGLAEKLLRDKYLGRMQ